MRRGIAGIVGGKVTAVERVRCSKRPILISPDMPRFRRRAIGRTVVAVGRIGKRLSIELDSGDAIIIEPRMTGLALVADPPGEEHLRFQMLLDHGRRAGDDRLLFWDRRGLGSVRLLTEEDRGRLFGPERVGPDALTTTPELLSGRLASSRRAIKVALLDQRAVAGVGNLYASEILHLAGVHPGRGCDTLQAGEWQRIHACLLEVLEEAIRHEGSTLSDGTYRNALNQAGGYQNCHRVYDREGEPCPGCGKAEIIRIVQAQRSTFFCGNCQPAGRRMRKIVRARS